MPLGVVARNYVNELSDQLHKGNAIIIASADVNDMTEIALSEHAGVQPFLPSQRDKPNFNGIVAYKDSEQAAFPTPSVFFAVTPKDESEPNQQGERGFHDFRGGETRPDRRYHSIYAAPYVPSGTNGDVRNDPPYTKYYAHIARFTSSINEENWITVLQGITGPATLGAAQVVTGGIHDQFTIFDHSIPAEQREARRAVLEAIRKDSESLEATLKAIEETSGGKPKESSTGNHDDPYEAINRMHMRQHSENLCKELNKIRGDAVEAIVRVFVTQGGTQHHDERRIAWWDFEDGFPRPIQVPDF